ncbi:RNA recognition motif domain-containing protein [Marinobacterium arenosum]|uniref:RNA recognition motif domain-containing protein n=1 Tax=Marinobacterium arenosum TaxID=2862496 RepID=UPI001C972B5F|nr:RNA-binding protein [Marinobacterium arenosum]MBY4676270.1 RNA-binding protein [Marinobacterium arenosum]
MRIFVGNLASDLAEEELLDCFSEFGEVEEIRLITDPETGLSRGFAFVTMPDRQQAREVIGQLHRTSLRGRPMQLEYARSRRG